MKGLQYKQTLSVDQRVYLYLAMQKSAVSVADVAEALKLDRKDVRDAVEKLRRVADQRSGLLAPDKPRGRPRKVGGRTVVKVRALRKSLCPVHGCHLYVRYTYRDGCVPKREEFCTGCRHVDGDEA